MRQIFELDHLIFYSSCHNLNQTAILLMNRKLQTTDNLQLQSRILLSSAKEKSPPV